MGKIKKIFAPKAPKPDPELVKAQREADAAAKRREERSQRELSAAQRAARGRSSGRRLLLAPGREDEMSKKDTLG